MLLIGIGIGLGLIVIYMLVLGLAAMLGIPLEWRKVMEKRAAIARQMQAESIEREAARNVELRAAERRLETP